MSLVSERFFSCLSLFSVVFFAFGTSCLYADEIEQPQTQKTQQGPDVVLRETPERTIYEYRQNRQLTMIKVVPKVGRPYFLVPVDRTENFGDVARADELKAQWVIREF